LCITTLTSAQQDTIWITEFESNPSGDDPGNEWVEFYVAQEISVNFFILENGDGDRINLTGNFSAGYVVYTFTTGWLDNTNEQVKLILLETVVSETPLFDDEDNNDKSRQLCNGAWEFKTQTKGADNGCSVVEETPEDEPEVNDTESDTEDDSESDDAGEDTGEDNETAPEETLSFVNNNVAAQTTSEFVIEAPPQKSAPIVLNSLPEKQTTITSKKQTERTIVVGGFIMTLILVILLLMVRRM